MLPEQLADELACRGLVPPALDQDLQHLALIIDRPPQGHLLPAMRTDHLIEIPARTGLAPPLPQVPRDHRPELAHLTPDGFVGDIQPPLRQQILHVPVSSA